MSPAMASSCLMLSSSPRIKNYLWNTREERNLNRKKLAAFLGHRTTSQLCRWETGREMPSLPNAFRLAYVLQTTVDVLFQDLRDEVVGEVRLHQMAQETEDEEE